MFKKFNTKLEKLFDQASQHHSVLEQDISEKNTNFQLINKNQMLENLSYVFSYEINNENLTNLFSQLSSYFEIGFLLKKPNLSNSYQVIDAFSFQQNIELHETLKPIKLPVTGIFNVLKTNGKQVLLHFGFSHLDPQSKMTSYMIPLAPNFSILVMTQTAEPWAQLKIEALQKTLMRINFSL